MNRHPRSQHSRLWATITQGFDEIIAQKDPKLLPNTWHATLYTALYNLMTTSFLREIDNHIAGVTDLHLQGNQKYPGADVYCTLLHKLNAELTNILDHASELQGETLLNYYSDQWSKYRVMARLLDHGCAYFTRHWVKHVVQKRRDIYTVEALAFWRWKVVVVDGLQGDDRRLTKALLDLVSSYRANQSTDLAVFKSVLASLAILGRSGKHGEVATPDVYQEVFENTFLEETTKHYRERVESLSAERIVQETWPCLAIEAALETTLPTVASFAKLQTTTNDLLVAAHAEELEAYMLGAIRDARHEDLKELYSSSLHLPDAVGFLRETFFRLFCEAISLTEGDGDPNAAESEVKRNLDSVEEVYLNIVRDDFKMDLILLEAFDDYTKSNAEDSKTG